MTELQQTELNILKQFLFVCEELDLTYYLVCGSALGAVKYGGFIPWDDDIDVALLRSDYEIFCKKAPVLLPDWCFLQDYRSDPQYHKLGAKLRDSRTTYIEQMTDTLDINHGVFIDVFPLDGKCSTKGEQRRFKCALSKFEAKRRVRLNYNRLTRDSLPMLRTNIDYLLYRLFGIGSDTASAIGEFDDYVSSFSTDHSDIWCNHANSASPLEYADKAQYGSGAWSVFEGIKVRVPEHFDEYLTQKYGDWRGDLPAAEQHGHHTYVVCDLKTPYTQYIKKGQNTEK